MTVLSAATLGITCVEHDALVQLLALLRDGVIPHVDPMAMDEDACAAIARTSVFNLAYPGILMECGFVGCAGAHLYLITSGIPLTGPTFDIPEDLAASARRYVENTRSPLHEVFSADALVCPVWPQITAAMQADAIENFLTTRSPDWPGIATRHGRADWIVAASEPTSAEAA